MPLPKPGTYVAKVKSAVIVENGGWTVVELGFEIPPDAVCNQLRHINGKLFIIDNKGKLVVSSKGDKFVRGIPRAKQCFPQAPWPASFDSIMDKLAAGLLLQDNEQVDMDSIVTNILNGGSSSPLVGMECSIEVQFEKDGDQIKVNEETNEPYVQVAFINPVRAQAMSGSALDRVRNRLGVLARASAAANGAGGAAGGNGGQAGAAGKTHPTASNNQTSALVKVKEAVFKAVQEGSGIPALDRMKVVGIIKKVVANLFPGLETAQLNEAQWKQMLAKLPAFDLTTGQPKSGEAEVPFDVGGQQPELTAEEAARQAAAFF